MAEKTKFERGKPHVNVGTIGTLIMGRQPLQQAILKTLSLYGLISSDKSVEQIDAAPEERPED